MRQIKTNSACSKSLTARLGQASSEQLALLPSISFPRTIQSLGDMVLHCTQRSKVDLAHAQGTSLSAASTSSDAGQQCDTLNHILGLQQMPAGKGNLCTGTNRDTEGVFCFNF